MAKKLMFKDQSVAVTGAAGGIGRAIAEMFVSEGAKVAICDLKDPSATADTIGASGFVCDVSQESSLVSFIRTAQEEHGALDIFVSNAGVGFGDPEHVADASNSNWETSWQVNVMQSVYAARALVPDWIKRGSGRFVITASAAGLLNQIGSASYSATKHAAVGFAEAIAIAHSNDGISTHCICPQYVRSDMTKGQKFAEDSKDGFLEPSDVANALREAIAKDEFLVLSHPVVANYFAHKGNNYQAYIDGMVKLKSKTKKEDLPL